MARVPTIGTLSYCFFRIGAGFLLADVDTYPQRRQGHRGIELGSADGIKGTRKIATLAVAEEIKHEIVRRSTLLDRKPHICPMI